ncbi:putative iron-regulated membrane protein [Maribacter vaceletii]|uniref:Putative iron-regulated membrane protein n=1 Tax=Maribacter vaceletii TaxID=1206816 RepID=A0A495EDU7_9FLAO|nr:PepSY domain-containing protein [Maribacter vaceletii]RKR15068.1 putative iron-regulated membrane protein [Maribacter vaceletii]
MKKNDLLNKWLWKWHVIAGLISAPFVTLLAITGFLYLLKADYETPKQKHITEVQIQGTPISFEKQLEIANKNAIKKPNAMVIPTQENQATEFVSGKFGGKKSLYINPYNATVSGEIIPATTLMFKIRKLHGELLLGTWGTKIVELIASWMVVLIISGLYVWWPSRRWSLKGFFIPRINQGKQILFRDLHVIFSFWISGLLLLTLAGGFPWTDVFGANFKWMQKVTNTGYPATWQGHHFRSNITGETLSLDTMVNKAKALQLKGKVSIELPKGPNGTYTVSNEFYSNLSAQKKIYFDQYSGTIIHQANWEDVGILMRGRMWVMAFHQGQFGAWNWWLMIFTAFALCTASISAIISYIKRKRKGSWSIPKVPKKFNIGYGIIGVIVLLAALFPLFGISLIFIFILEKFRKRKVTTN